MAEIKKILVGKTGYCDYATIQAAVNSINEDSVQKTEIIILAGTYEEIIRVYSSNLIFSGIGDVRIVGNLYAKQLDKLDEPIGTFRTPTFFINGEHITLNNLTIENAAGQGHLVGQAVALYSEGNDVVVNHCRLLAHQDTLCIGPLPEKNKYGHGMSNYLKHNSFDEATFFLFDSYVEGTIDFIFGGGEAVFTRCELVSKRNETSSPNFISAPSTLAGQTGFHFDQCYVHGQQPYFLGRPWREFGQSIFTRCYFDEQLEKDGWDNWDKVSNQETARFEERGNHYLGPVNRASWIKYNKEEGQ